MTYWSKITKDPDYWFYKSQKDWEIETGLSRHEQDSARKILKERNLIFEKRAGIPATIHFKINFEACLHRLLYSGNLKDEELTKLFAGSRQSSSPVNGNLFTETTIETKPKNTTTVLPYGELFVIAWQRWIAYKKERKEKFTETTRASQLKTLAGFKDEQAAVEAIEQSIRNGWRGLFDPREKKNGARVQTTHNNGFVE